MLAFDSANRTPLQALTPTFTRRRSRCDYLFCTQNYANPLTYSIHSGFGHKNILSFPAFVLQFFDSNGARNISECNEANDMR